MTHTLKHGMIQDMRREYRFENKGLKLLGLFPWIFAFVFNNFSFEVTFIKIHLGLRGVCVAPLDVLFLINSHFDYHFKGFL